MLLSLLLWSGSLAVIVVAFAVAITVAAVVAVAATKITIVIRENFKYYFADFVRKGGTPPHFTDKIFAKKKVTDLGGTPPSPFTDTPPKNVLQKVLKMAFFAQKTPVFGPKNRLRIWGVPLPPLYGQNLQSSI